MNRRTIHQFEVLVIGGGPAGVGAATRAAECGLHAAIVDDNPALGGQIWRGRGADQPEEAATWLGRLRKARVECLCGTRVFDQPEPGILLAEASDHVCELKYGELVLASGARERFLPFPGWTLPNVMGAGGLQAMVKSGLPIAQKKVVVAGSGPLLLAVAAYLRQHGAVIVAICEQASARALMRFGAALLKRPQKIRQAFSLKRELSGVPFWTSSWPVVAEGKGVVESVMVSRGGRKETLACDYLACGFHLVPNCELAALLGCEMENGCVRVSEFQETSVPHVFCAGEPTGVGGYELALVEGEIAGLAAAGQKQLTGRLFSRREKLRNFARALERAFSLGDELKKLAMADTLVCRCEDVAYSRLQSCASWRAAKLYTRCGMGPCQGRICGTATQFLFGWTPESVRPPVFPTAVQNLAIEDTQGEQITGER